VTPQVPVSSEEQNDSSSESDDEVAPIFSQLDASEQHNSESDIFEDVESFEEKPKDAHEYIPVTQLAPRDINSSISQDNILPDNVKRNLVTFACHAIPKNYTDYRNNFLHDIKWKDAIAKELSSLETMGTFSPPLDLPVNRRTVGSRWVFDTKTNEKGEVIKYKARLVAQGYTQIHGVDYDDTYAPVARIVTWRIFFSLSVLFGISLHQIDAITAYLNSPMDKEIYLRIPDGYSQHVDSNFVLPVLRLRKGLYGLKQAGKLWNNFLVGRLSRLNFRPSTSDPGLFVHISSVLAFIVLHVDDLLLLIKDQDLRGATVKNMNQLFKIKDLGIPEKILGCGIDVKVGQI
jgi:hypothetical protein